MRTLASLDMDDVIEDILITLGKQYHLIRPLSSSKGALFFYVALDRTRSNLALATTIIEAPWRCHGPRIRDHIAAIHALPALAGKLRLNILNGLRGIFDRGPAPRGARWQWDPHSLVVSADPLLLDAVARAVVERRRSMGRT